MTNKVPVRAFCSNTLFRSEKFAVVKCSAKWRDFFACKTVCSFHRGSIRSKNSAPPSTNVSCSGSSAFIVSTLLNHLRLFAEKLWALRHCILAAGHSEQYGSAGRTLAKHRSRPLSRALRHELGPPFGRPYLTPRNRACPHLRR